MALRSINNAALVGNLLAFSCVENIYMYVCIFRQIKIVFKLRENIMKIAEKIIYCVV